MKFKKLVAGFVIGLALSLPMSVALEGVISEPMIVEAVDDLGDDVGGGSTNTNDNGMSDFIKGWENVDGEQLQDASVKLTPITNLIGWCVGALTVLVVALVPLITLLDLAYIAIPPVRNLLFVDGQQTPTGGYGGYGMQQQQTTHEKRQWVSDEAVQCAALIGNNQQSGAMSQGGPYGASIQQTQQNMPTKSVIGVYFKKRVFFIILFVLCLVVLTSSILLGTGVNLAQWVMNIINEVNNFIPR